MSAAPLSNPKDMAPGRDASSPFAIPAAGWKDILVRTWKEAGEDNAGLVAAGVSFYGFLALVPLLGAIVLSYGLIAEPETVMRNMKNLTSVMPTDAATLIGEQLMNVVKTSGSKKGLGLLLALALALFGARNGAASIVTALNIAYEEKETRTFIRLNLLALAITAAGVIVAIIALVAIAALGHLAKLFPGAPDFVLALGKLLSYLFVALGGAAGAATLYRYAPNRRTAKWVWLTPGSLFAAVAWLSLTIGFGIYVADFGNYNATYGSLGAAVVMLTWLYLSSYVLLLAPSSIRSLSIRLSVTPRLVPSTPWARGVQNPPIPWRDETWQRRRFRQRPRLTRGTVPLPVARDRAWPRTMLSRGQRSAPAPWQASTGSAPRPPFWPRVAWPCSGGETGCPQDWRCSPPAACLRGLADRGVQAGLKHDVNRVCLPSLGNPHQNRG